MKLNNKLSPKERAYRAKQQAGDFDFPKKPKPQKKGFHFDINTIVTYEGKDYLLIDNQRKEAWWDFDLINWCLLIRPKTEDDFKRDTDKGVWFSSATVMSVTSDDIFSSGDEPIIPEALASTYGEHCVITWRRESHITKGSKKLNEEFTNLIMLHEIK